MRASTLLTNGCFAAACAVALAWETSLVARTPTPAAAFYAFVFCATWAAYRVHRFGRPFRVGHAFTAALGLSALVLAARLPRDLWPWLAVAAVASWGYALPLWPRGRRIREFGLAKIATLAGTWTVVTAVCPLLGTGLPVGEIAFLALRRLTFMFALCLAFDVRDRAADARAGIRTLPVRVGVARSYALARVALLAFALLLLTAPLATARDPAHRPAAMVTLALVMSTALTWLAIELARAPFAGRLYYHGVVDGMMAVQGALVGLAWWVGRASGV